MLEEVKVFWDIMPHQLVNSYVSNALCCFKMSVTLYQSTQHNIPDDLNVHQPHCGNVSSHVMLGLFLLRPAFGKNTLF